MAAELPASQSGPNRSPEAGRFAPQRRFDFLIANASPAPVNCFFEPLCNEINLQPGQTLSVTKALDRATVEERRQRHREAADMLIETYNGGQRGVVVWDEAWDAVSAYFEGWNLEPRFADRSDPRGILPPDFDPLFALVIAADDLPAPPIR